MTTFADDGAAMPRYCSARWQGGGARRWHPFEIAALVVGFAFWWPIGFAILALKFAERRGYRMGRMFGRAREAFSDVSARRQQGWAWQPFSAPGTTGNTAFDDWRSAEMARLDEERRKLDAAERDFAEHLATLRRAKDKQEFDAFMAARQTGPAA